MAFKSGQLDNCVSSLQAGGSARLPGPPSWPTPTRRAMGTITGLVLLVLATLTLPALMRLVVPMVSAVGNLSLASAAGAAIGAATGAVAIVATGAAVALVVAGGVGRSTSSLDSSAMDTRGGSEGVAGGPAQVAYGTARAAPSSISVRRPVRSPI